MLLTWRSTVRSLIVRPVAIGSVRPARRKQSQDLDLAPGQSARTIGGGLAGQPVEPAEVGHRAERREGPPGGVELELRRVARRP